MDRTAPEIVLGRYTLGEVLGHGGSATVYRAWDRHTERAVALKRFVHGADGPDRYRQRAEVRTLARLDHPGLVRLLDAGAEDGRAHLVMDLVEGPSLGQRLAHGCLPVADVVVVGALLADALAYIHAEEITHRDVKPANVLLDPAHGPRLADFGIARLVDSTRVTATDAVVGTAAYMAPEQLRGAPVGPAADVYALGLVLLEAATGGLGLPGTGLEMVLTRLSTAPSIPEALPAPLRTLLQTMTDGKPQRRPSARQVAAALTGFQDDRQSSVGLGVAPAATATAPVAVAVAVPDRLGTHGGSRSAPASRRRRRIAVAAAGVLVAAATALAIVLGGTGGPTPGARAVIATSPAQAAPPSDVPGPVGVAAPPAEQVRPAASIAGPPAPAPTVRARASIAPPAGPSRAGTGGTVDGGHHDAEGRGSGDGRSGDRGSGEGRGGSGGSGDG